jgi:hypothetical protein
MTSAPKPPKRREKNPSKRMTKKSARPSTTRSTAGPGFDFEDHVAAWLLLKVLSGQPIPGVEGAGTRLQMQTEALGWSIDDILLTATVSQDDQRHLAISCKSNVQVTTSGLPADFMIRCWRQWAKTDPNPIHWGKDCLMLVTRGQNNAFMATWSDLKSAGLGADLGLALGRMLVTSKHRKIFDSVKIPAIEAGVIADDSDVVMMVNSIRVAPLDFHIANSEDERIAIKEARTLLMNGSLAEGQRLWGELVAHARNTRLGAGTLDISELWLRLRVNFKLKDHPDFQASWQTLRALTHDHKATIETALPSGLSLNRRGETDRLMDKIATAAVCVVFGESGTGKSALVKATLDACIPDATQVWLTPDTLDLALSEMARMSAGISQPLLDVLNATARAKNFLVIDAAERLSRDCALKTKGLIEELTKRRPLGARPGWHVLIVGQTEAWLAGTLQELTGAASPENLEVGEAPDDAVSQALHSAAGLEWLATHADALSALKNLRTLAWVIQAATRFQGLDGSDVLSLTAIADRLWGHWTDSKPSIQRLLIRLAEREAAFEHSFAVSEFGSGDAAVLDDLPIGCPLRRDRTSGRIQFQHDLAADWTRFQRLKEIADDAVKWSLLASNPFWHSALRMLGQFLLRRQLGSRNAWDVAFEVAEQHRETAPLADDLLLDALFLDPNAEAFLDARAEILLANGGTRLLRLAKRFEHVASVPGPSVDMQSRFRDLSLYIEAHFRTPIFRRWPSMARFLAKNRDRIAKMTSPTIAGLCRLWLTSTPSVLPSVGVVPFRREFAELALASAREAQLIHAKRMMASGDGEAAVYQAALFAAPDLPADISEWALEMARRRPYRADVVKQVEVHRAERAKEHATRLATDPEYRKQYELRRGMPTVVGLSGRKLPPWPLGPKARLDGQFREAVLHSAGFQALMREDSAVAGEVLLACIIEEAPEEEYGSSPGVDDHLGIELDDEGYPTAPWKSPFYVFLQINPNAALSYLHQLINFSTDRWAQTARRRSGSDPVPLSLGLVDGTAQEYVGNSWVFNWSHQNSHFTGQLNCALAALERWLCDRIDIGVDVAPQVGALLQTTHSVAVLGVLVNVGKHRVELFRGPLRPLLGVQHIYDWDWQRVKEDDYAFDAMTWARSGEVVFAIAKNWVLAPYRKKTLRAIVPDIILAHKEVGDFVLAASSQWVSPDRRKDALEFAILLAELDHRNYSAEIDSETGKQRFAFAYPPKISAAIAAFEGDTSRLRQALIFPPKCRNVLEQARILDLQEAKWVASLMAAVDGDEEIDIDEEMLRAPRVAAAAVLLSRAPEYLAQNPVVRRRAQSIMDAAIAGISDAAQPCGSQILAAPSHLEFAAYFAAECWIAESSTQNDERVLRLLTSGDDRAVQVLSWSAYRCRETLGHRWWRLLYLALLWSGLSMLAPSYGDEMGDQVRWQKWRQWLRARSLSAGNATAASLSPLSVAERVERFEFKRLHRRYGGDGRRYVQEPGRRLSGSLDTHFLRSAFAWLVRGQAEPQVPAQDLETHRQLAQAFWAHQAWWQLGSGKDETDDYRVMNEFGYAILEELARLMTVSPARAAPALWRPVFALGPKGHYAVGHFLTCWFSQISKATIVAEFAQRWRPMVEFMLLDEVWVKGDPWYYRQRMERQVLGFGSSDSIKQIPNHAALIGMMRDLFEVWASRRLTRDEDNLAGFCAFLGTEIAGPLRMDGLQWIANAMKATPNLGKWFRDRTSNAFMEFLDVLISEHATELVRDDRARQALLDLSAHAVSRQLTASLALQERIRRLC